VALLAEVTGLTSSKKPRALHPTAKATADEGTRPQVTSKVEVATQTRRPWLTTTRPRPTRKPQAAKRIAKELRSLHRLWAPSERQDDPRMSGLLIRERIVQLIHRRLCRAKVKEAAGKMERFQNLKLRRQ
jgi:hypothetical protein